MADALATHEGFPTRQRSIAARIALEAIGMNRRIGERVQRITAITGEVAERDNWSGRTVS